MRALLACAVLLAAPIAGATALPPGSAADLEPPAASDGLRFVDALWPSFLPASYGDTVRAALAAPGAGYVAASRSLHHDLHAIGDADGDGRTDILVRSEEGVRLLSAGRPDQILWTSEKALLPTGDLDSDGVDELIEPREEATADADRFAATITYDVRSGRDLNVLLSTEAVMYHRVVTEAELAPGVANPAPQFLPVGRHRQVDEHLIPWLVVYQGHAWLLEFMMWSEHERETVLGTTMTWDTLVGTALSRIGPDGQRVWTHGGLDAMVSSLGGDVDDDGIPEALFGNSFRFTFTWNSDPLTGSWSEETPSGQARVEMVAGSDGRVLLQAEPPDWTFFYPTWFGDLWGEGPVIGMSVARAETTVSQEGTESTVESHLVLLDAAGAVRISRSWPTFGLVIPNGDVDGDRLDDLLSYTLSRDGATAYNGTLETLWHAPGDVRGILDADGDDALDVIVQTGGAGEKGIQEASLVDGRTGAAGATLVYEGRLQTTADVDMDGGDDVIVVHAQGEGDDAGLRSIDMRLVSGKDGRDIWTKRVFDAAQYSRPVWADPAHLLLAPIGRVDGDKAPDLLLVMRHVPRMEIVCDGDACWIEDDSPGAPALDADAILSAADGKTLLRFDDMPVAGTVAETPVELGAAGRALQSRANDSPMAVLAWSMAALVALVAWRRR